jgi:hypothetical protein
VKTYPSIPFNGKCADIFLFCYPQSFMEYEAKDVRQSGYFAKPVFANEFENFVGKL